MMMMIIIIIIIYDDITANARFCSTFPAKLSPLVLKFGTATPNRLDRLGIESRWWRRFSHLSKSALGPTQPPVQWKPGLLGGKAVGV